VHIQRPYSCCVMFSWRELSSTCATCIIVAAKMLVQVGPVRLFSLVVVTFYFIYTTEVISGFAHIRCWIENLNVTPANVNILHGFVFHVE